MILSVNSSKSFLLILVFFVTVNSSSFGQNIILENTGYRIDKGVLIDPKKKKLIEDVKKAFHIKNYEYHITTDIKHYIIEISPTGFKLRNESNLISSHSFAFNDEDIRCSVTIRKAMVQANYSSESYEERSVAFSIHPFSKEFNQNNDHNTIYSSKEKILITTIPNSSMSLVIDLRKGRFETLYLDQLSQIKNYRSTYWFKSENSLIAVVETKNNRFYSFNIGAKLPSKVNGKLKNGIMTYPDQSFEIQNIERIKLKSLPLSFKNGSPVYSND